MENVTSSDAAILLTFSWLDYTIFFSLFGVSAFIGIYFGCFGSKQATTAEYLLGSKTMSVFPVAMSLTASHLSGITLLGVPSEIYAYGTQYMACLFIAMLAGVIISEVYLPVFYVLELNSSYEYLKRRFDEKIRLVALLLYVISTLTYLPIVIYIPSLAFNQVSGIPINKMAPLICAICIFYTTLGGLKGVVWTDTVQFTLTHISIATVLILGTIKAGGLAKIWEIAEQGDRIEFFIMDLDPTVRTTFWGILFGYTMSWVASLGINPASVQRYLSVPSLKKAKMCALLLGLGVLVTKAVTCFSGLIIYANYHDCDPLKSGKVGREDQILPYYVLDVARNIPGLPGLFISGVFSTALSTMSSHLNTMAGTIYEDFLYKYMPAKTTEAQSNNIIKATVVIIGLICLGLVFVVENLGMVMQISNSLAGITLGPLLGVFSLGMLFPSATTKGALYGSMASLVAMTWIIGGNQYHLMTKHIVHEHKPLSVEKCDDFNLTSIATNITAANLSGNYAESEPFVLFRVSFYWYTLIGAVLVVIIGLLISWMSDEENETKYDKELYSPIVHRFVPEDPRRYEMVDVGKCVNNKKQERDPPMSYEEATMR